MQEVTEKTYELIIDVECDECDENTVKEEVGDGVKGQMKKHCTESRDFDTRLHQIAKEDGVESLYNVETSLVDIWNIWARSIRCKKSPFLSC